MAIESNETSGVQQLIDKLREEGVEQGKGEADALLNEARHKATEMLDNARIEADTIAAEARREADRMKASGLDSLKLASRDVILSVKESFRAEFVSKIRQLVGHTMHDREFLEKLILAIAGRAVPHEDGKPIEVLLPDHPVTVEQLRQEPASTDDDSISQFALGLAADVLRDGITFASGHAGATGVSVRLIDEDVQIELTDETITELLMQHLLPRFRAIIGE